MNCSCFRDNVEWDPEQEKAAKEKVEQNSQVMFAEGVLKDLEENADKHWDAFYNIHQNRYCLFLLNLVLNPKIE